MPNKPATSTAAGKNKRNMPTFLVNGSHPGALKLTSSQPGLSVRAMRNRQSIRQHHPWLCASDTSTPATCLRPPLLPLHRIEPRTDARHHAVVARQHLDRPAQAAFGVGEPHLARFLALLGTEPHALMAPDAGTFLAFGGLPCRRVDIARAPTVFDHETRRVPGIERGDEVPAMAAERDRDTAVFAGGEIVALADIVE